MKYLSSIFVVSVLAIGLTAPVMAQSLTPPRHGP